MDQWLSCAYCFIGSIESVNVVTNGQQWHQVKSAPGHFGTRLGQFGTSVINNFVIIKYLYIYIKKETKLDLLASTKYNL